MRARVAASVALIAATAALLAGCGLFNEPGTETDYDPSDGVNAEIGELALRNVLVISTDGDLGNLVMTAVNNGEQDLDVTLQYETDGIKHEVEISVDGNSVADFGFGTGGQLLLEDIGTEPGDLLELYVQFGSEPGVLLNVPVLDGTQSEYVDLVPTPTPVPLPSPEGPEITGTPEPEPESED